MKTFFWFAVVVLLLITFSDREPIKPYRDALYGQVLEMIPDNWQSDSQALGSIQRKFTELGKSLGQGQQELLAKAATDKASIVQFRQRYCIDKDFNPVLFGEPLQKSCAIIEEYYSRLLGN